MQDVAAPTGEAAPSTPNTEPAPIAPEAPAPAPAITPEQVATYLGTTPEMLESFQKYTSSNGGLDRTFDSMKKALNTRQADVPVQPQAQAPIPSPVNDFPQAPQPMAQPAPQPLVGGITPEEFMTQQYFMSLASQEQYANIAEQMRSGEVLKEMAKFDIMPMVNGQFNDAKVRNFLDLYSKSQPALQPAAPVTSTPTVEYVEVGETITSMEEAMQVLSQDQQLRAQGKAGHPRAADANKFFDAALSANQNRGKVEHKTLDQAQAK